jgi:hypothetical protein
MLSRTSIKTTNKEKTILTLRIRTNETGTIINRAERMLDSRTTSDMDNNSPRIIQEISKGTKETKETGDMVITEMEGSEEITGMGELRESI